MALHPNYREVIFLDITSGKKFLTRSTAPSTEKTTWEDGRELPLVKVEISSSSHPFYTNKKIFVDTAGRVERFMKKYAKKQK